jgi:hypothetical protein
MNAALDRSRALTASMKSLPERRGMTDMSATIDHRAVAGPRNTHCIKPTQEHAMKLTSAQVERALVQFKGEAIPDSHPVIPQLNRLFGEHTFFLDGRGLNIVEPAEVPQPGRDTAMVINVASWSDADPNKLEPHEPEPTDVVVTLGSKH